MKKLSIITVLALLVSAAGFAETMSLTADAAVALALENNLSLQSDAIDLSIKERAKDTAWNAFIPSINASMGIENSGLLLADPSPTAFDYSTFSYISVDPPDRIWSVSGGLSAVLPINMALGTGIKQTRIDYENGVIGYEDSRKRLDKDVRKYYYLLIATIADLELKKQNIEIAEKRYQQARENYNNGLISELEMLQSQVSAENNKPVYNSQLIQYKNNLMNFKLLLGIPGTTELTLEERIGDVTFYDFSARELIDSYSANRLDVLQINKSIESLKNTRKLQNEYNRTPSLSLSAIWGTQIDDSFEDESWEKDVWYDNATIGLDLTIPLDDFIPLSGTDVLLKDLDDQIRQLEIQRQLVFDAAEIEISNLVMTLNNSINTIDTYSLNVDLARKSFELTTEAYNLGTRELLDVESAQTDLLSASQNVLYEKLNYINNLLDLEYAVNADKISEVLEEK